MSFNILINDSVLFVNSEWYHTNTIVSR